MKKQMTKLIAAAALAAFITTTTFNVVAQEKKPAAPSDEKKENTRPIPFSGSINEIDKSAKTIQIGKAKKRTIQITDQTKIKKAGKEATLSDAAVGDEVGGSYRESADGKMEALSLRIGPKPEGEAKGLENKKEK